MKQMLEMIGYNSWANQKFRDTLSTISFDKLKAETIYGPLIERIIHIFASIDLWLARIDGKSPTSMPTSKDFQTWDTIVKAWELADRRLLTYARSTKSLDELDKKISYKSIKGDPFESTIGHILTHLSHHQMYHRGQVAMSLRQLKLPAAPQTDVIVFFRSPDKEKYL